MTQLIPGRNFTVVRQIGNHTDTGTYYVRAVIRDAYSDVILDTLDLVDKGGLRFKKDWLVPVEPSGLGKFISIVTSVYTDSAYTTKSENYSDEENTYLWAVLNMNTGGGMSAMQSEKFNYARIKKYVDDAVASIPPPPPFPEMPTPKEYEMRWDDVLSRLDDIESKIESLPKENNDDTPIMEKLDEIVGAIEAKDVTPVTDLSPILSKLDEKNESDEVTHDEVKSLLAKSNKEVITAVGKTVSELFDKTSFVTSFATHVAHDGAMTGKHKKMMQENMKEANEPEEPEEDYNGIANSLTS